MKNAWRLWAKAIGEKEGTTDAEADKIAMIRTLIVGVNFITCFFIIAGKLVTPAYTRFMQIGYKK